MLGQLAGVILAICGKSQDLSYDKKARCYEYYTNCIINQGSGFTLEKKIKTCHKNEPEIVTKERLK